MNRFLALVALHGILLSLSMSAFSSEISWKEEVLLHDSSKIIVTRSQMREGGHEIGQGPLIKEHTIIFTPPGANKSITWKSDDQYFRGLGLHLLLIDFLNGTPYLVTKPAGSLAYNKWGKPNPPYIFLRYVDQQWKQISLEEFPSEFMRPNVVIDVYGEKDIKIEEKKSGFVSSESVKKLNNNLTQEEYKTIVRTPLDIWKPRQQYMGSKAPHMTNKPAAVPSGKE